jgi:hypothetical protein
VPTDALEALALRQALEEPDAVALSEQAVDVIEDDRQMAMLPEVAVVLPLKVTGLVPL